MIQLLSGGRLTPAPRPPARGAVRVMRGANDTLYVLIMDDPFYVIPPSGKGSVSFAALPERSSRGGGGRSEGARAGRRR